jgi:hypothetical protein
MFVMYSLFPGLDGTPDDDVAWDLHKLSLQGRPAGTVSTADLIAKFTNLVKEVSELRSESEKIEAGEKGVVGFVLLEDVLQVVRAVCITAMFPKPSICSKNYLLEDSSGTTRHRPQL